MRSAIAPYALRRASRVDAPLRSDPVTPNDVARNRSTLSFS
jgi:hypothetical protein